MKQPELAAVSEAEEETPGQCSHGSDLCEYPCQTNKSDDAIVMWPFRALDS